MRPSRRVPSAIGKPNSGRFQIQGRCGHIWSGWQRGRITWGRPYDKHNAEWILARFQEWGLDAKIESFDVPFPTPKERLVEMVEPTRFTAKLAEPTVAVDPTSSQHQEQLPVYNAYSIDGDVTAPLVYVNFGIPEDYEMLDCLGISVKGAIVIARYGQSWRGIKPKVAAEHGAVGCAA